VRAAVGIARWWFSTPLQVVAAVPVVGLSLVSGSEKQLSAIVRGGGFVKQYDSVMIE
jgi:hypothetical protein